MIRELSKPSDTRRNACIPGAWISTLTVVLVLLCASFLCVSASQAQQRPNIIVVQLSDVRGEMLRDSTLLEHLPNLNRLQKEGSSFTNFHVTSPLRHASLATLLRGQYATDMGFIGGGLWSSSEPDGEQENRYRELGLEQDDLAFQLRRRQYRTMLVGRYFDNRFQGTLPNGWEDLSLSYGDGYFETPRLKKTRSEAPALSMLENDEYRTAFEGRDVLELIRSHHESESSGDEPFFLLWTPLAAELNLDRIDAIEEMIDRRNVGARWPELAVPGGEEFNEADVSDKHPSLGAREPLAPDQLSHLLETYQAQTLALKSVDKVIGNLRRLLGRLNLEENTIIVVTSNGGVATGHHRAIGKSLPYDCCTRAPLIVWGSPIATTGEVNELLADVDLMPTVLELAQIDTPDYVAGVSFASLLTNDESSSWSGRPSIPTQSWQLARDPFTRDIYPTMYSKLRMRNSAYIEWADGFREFYDLTRDPSEIQNLYEQLSDEQKAQFHSQLLACTSDSGISHTTLTQPAGDNIVRGGELRIKGYASATAEISAIEIVVQNTTSNEFWNGIEWQAERIGVAATLSNSGFQTEWSYIVDSPDLAADSSSLAVQAFTVVNRAIASQSDPIAFRVDSQAPRTNVTFPEPEMTIDGRVRIEGVSQDDSSIDRVILSIRRRNANEFWNGTAFQTESTRVYFEAGADGKWVYEADLPAGQYSLVARSRDVVGNIDVEPVRVAFTVE